MNRWSRNSALVLTLLLLVAQGPALVQGASKDPAKAEKKVSQPVVVADFTYSSQGLRDPFEALYLTRVQKSRAGEARKTGYELEELKLVGVIKTGPSRYAMMEDVQGKGMLFKKGDYLNKNMWVMDITEEKVVMAYKVKGDIRQIGVDIPKK
jgi:Tfp pilus assembly protein PilP